MIKIYDMETLEEREILFRGGSGADVSAPVAEILRAVQERGDAALREYTLRFDGAAPDALAVTAEEVDQAAAQVEPAFLAVLEEAAPGKSAASWALRYAASLWGQVHRGILFDDPAFLCCPENALIDHDD